MGFFLLFYFWLGAFLFDSGMICVIWCYIFLMFLFEIVFGCLLYGETVCFIVFYGVVLFL